MIQNAILNLADRHNLNKEMVEESVREIIDGTASPAQVGALLLGLRSKGETAEEIAAFASALRRYSIRIFPEVGERIIDTCGTGGDLAESLNVSTLAAVVAAGAGAKVAKHGNRSVSSRCGSADLIERLGVNLSASPELCKMSIEQIGIGFLFAPAFHPALKKVATIRKELGTRTIFNLVGPLMNPAPVKGQLMGVHSPSLVPVMAEVLRKIGLDEAMVVHGSEGIDEISVRGKTKISWLRDGEIRTNEYTPDELGVKCYDDPPLKIKDVEDSAVISLKILDGSLEGMGQDMVVVNAAAALVISGNADGFEEGCEMARMSIQDGSAMKKLEQLIRFTGGDVSKVRYLAENTA